MVRTRSIIIEDMVVFKEMRGYDTFIHSIFKDFKVESWYNPVTKMLVTNNTDINIPVAEFNRLLDMVGNKLKSVYVEELEEPVIDFSKRRPHVVDRLVSDDKCVTLFGTHMYRKFINRYVRNNSIDLIRICCTKNIRDKGAELLFVSSVRSRFIVESVRDKLSEINESEVSMRDAVDIVIALNGFTSASVLKEYLSLVE